MPATSKTRRFFTHVQPFKTPGVVAVAVDTIDGGSTSDELFADGTEKPLGSVAPGRKWTPMWTAGELENLCKDNLWRELKLEVSEDKELKPGQLRYVVDGGIIRLLKPAEVKVAPTAQQGAPRQTSPAPTVTSAQITKQEPTIEHKSANVKSDVKSDVKQDDPTHDKTLHKESTPQPIAPPPTPAKKV